MMCKVLIFGCIAAVILMTAAYGASLPTELLLAQKRELAQKQELLEASIMDLGKLKNFENDCLDFNTPNDTQCLQFYTPNDTQECNWTTLECYLRELELLKHEVGEEHQRHIINIKKNLDDFKAGYSSDLKCKTCESNDKKRFPEFHQELERFLQRMRKEIA